MFQVVHEYMCAWPTHVGGMLHVNECTFMGQTAGTIGLTESTGVFLKSSLDALSSLLHLCLAYVSPIPSHLLLLWSWSGEKVLLKELQYVVAGKLPPVETEMRKAWWDFKWFNIQISNVCWDINLHVIYQSTSRDNSGSSQFFLTTHIPVGARLPSDWQIGTMECLSQWSLTLTSSTY